MPSIIVVFLLLVLFVLVRLTGSASGCEYIYPYGDFIICEEGYIPFFVV
jgi:hypothetical protein